MHDQPTLRIEVDLEEAEAPLIIVESERIAAHAMRVLYDQLDRLSAAGKSEMFSVFATDSDRVEIDPSQITELRLYLGDEQISGVPPNAD